MVKLVVLTFLLPLAEAIYLWHELAHNKPFKLLTNADVYEQTGVTLVAIAIGTAVGVLIGMRRTGNIRWMPFVAVVLATLLFAVVFLVANPSEPARASPTSTEEGSQVRYASADFSNEAARAQFFARLLRTLFVTSVVAVFAAFGRRTHRVSGPGSLRAGSQLGVQESDKKPQSGT